MAASVFAATAGAVALLNRTYEKVWGGSASKTIKGKETATKHFNKFLLNVGVEQELNQWTVRTARDILSIDFIQMFGGYISEATSFDTGDLLMRDTTLQYFSGVKTVLVHMFARKLDQLSSQSIPSTPPFYPILVGSVPQLLFCCTSTVENSEYRRVLLHTQTHSNCRAKCAFHSTPILDHGSRCTTPTQRPRRRQPSGDLDPTIRRRFAPPVFRGPT